MIAFSRTVRVWAYRRPVDLRNGYNGLMGLIARELGRDPLSGDLFLFQNRPRTGCKVFLWDGTGLCILAKKLERGSFANLAQPGNESGELQMTAGELALFIEGCTLVGRQKLAPPEVALNCLAR